MSISQDLKKMMKAGSAIRKMFEQGAILKREYGEKNVFDFSLGNPDIYPPQKFHSIIRNIISRSIPAQHSYMPNAGYPLVRQKIGEYLSGIHKSRLNADNIIMTVGASGAMNIILKTILNKNDEVIIISPYFVEYKFYINNHNGIPVVISSDKDFNPDLKQLKKVITKKTRALIINSPNNPTGKVYNKKILDEIGKILKLKSKTLKTTIYLISDEPYRQIIFDNVKVPSVFRCYNNSIIADSFSKTLSIPGERIGYAAINPESEYKEELFNGMVLSNRILGFVNAPALMQNTISKMLYTTVNMDVYKKRRSILYNSLKKMGYKIRKPEGTFYLFPESPVKDDVKFVEYLQEYKILAVPGAAFGAPGYFRLCYCLPDSAIKKSLSSFKEAIENCNKDCK